MKKIFINQNRPLPHKGRYISTNLDALRKLVEENDIEDLVYNAIQRGDMRTDGDWEVPVFGGWTTKNMFINADIDTNFHPSRDITTLTIDGKSCPVIKMLIAPDEGIPVGAIGYLDHKGKFRLYNPLCGNINQDDGGWYDPYISFDYNDLKNMGVNVEYFFSDRFDPDNPNYYDEQCNVEYDEQSMDKDCCARLIPVD